MATSLSKQSSDKLVEYECNGKTVKLSPSIIRNYLVSGGGNVTDQEVVMFLNLCKFQNLNPFLREAYLVKYGNSDATMVTGKEVFTKRAKRNKEYRGFEAGIIVKRGNDIEYINGTFKLPEDALLGGWAKVHIENFRVPIEISVSLDEYIGKKSNGEVNSQWAKKPATMIRKVALVQALREAFPEEFQGMYSEEEAGNIDVKLDTEPVPVPEEQQNVIEAEFTPVDDPLA